MTEILPGDIVRIDQKHANGYKQPFRGLVSKGGLARVISTKHEEDTFAGPIKLLEPVALIAFAGKTCPPLTLRVECSRLVRAGGGA